MARSAARCSKLRGCRLGPHNKVVLDTPQPADSSNRRRCAPQSDRDVRPLTTQKQIWPSDWQDPLLLFFQVGATSVDRPSLAAPFLCPEKQRKPTRRSTVEAHRLLVCMAGLLLQSRHRLRSPKYTTYVLRHLLRRGIGGATYVVVLRGRRRQPNGDRRNHMKGEDAERPQAGVTIAFQLLAARVGLARASLQWKQHCLSVASSVETPRWGVSLALTTAFTLRGCSSQPACMILSPQLVEGRRIQATSRQAKDPDVPNGDG